MHSRTLTTVLAATALMLSGCTNEPETKLEPGQKAFVFESGVVPIGDFDPYAFELDELFDPCNEISEEEFKRAGILGEKQSSTRGEIESVHGTSVCMFVNPDKRSSINVLNVHANQEVSKQMRTLREDLRSTVLPEIYFYQQDQSPTSTGICIAQVDTKIGAIGVFFTTLDKNYSNDEMCIASMEKLESLYQINKH